MGNSQRLDGGAMFGHAPKVLWSRWHDCDEQNRIFLACRALLIEVGQRKILLEAGIGSFFDPAMKKRYGVIENNHRLLMNLNEMGIDESEITDIVLSHLHFDHAGGVLSQFEEKKPPLLAFSRAQFYVSREGWKRATQPVGRDKASFIPELQPLLENSGRLTIINHSDDHPLHDFMRFHFSEGHTPGLMISEVKITNRPIFFVTDLMPGISWMNTSIAMGYDRYPELLIEEKTQLLSQCYEKKGALFFTHDPHFAMVDVGKDDQGNFIPLKKYSELSRINSLVPAPLTDEVGY